MRNRKKKQESLNPDDVSPITLDKLGAVVKKVLWKPVAVWRQRVMSSDYKPFPGRSGHVGGLPIQEEEPTGALRTGLWNRFYAEFLESYLERRPSFIFVPEQYDDFMLKQIFIKFIGVAADDYARWGLQAKVDVIKGFFLDKEWSQVLYLIEFVARTLLEEQAEMDFINGCNATLRKENSAYRIIKGIVTEITSEQEIVEIETALKIPYAPAKEHLGKALTLLSDRKNPDYENSIKESIHAVESIAKEITGKEKSLNALTQTLKLPPGPKTALDEFYKWTSKYGIRHAKSRKSLPLDQATARFMSVICSAFVNYIIARNQATQD